MLNICKKAEKEAVFITLEGCLDTTTGLPKIFPGRLPAEIRSL